MPPYAPLDEPNLALATNHPLQIADHITGQEHMVL